MKITRLILPVFLAAAWHLNAQDCGAVPAPYRAQCESAMKAKSACNGKTGDEYKKCITGNLNYSEFNDCAKETDSKKKAACEYRTQVQTACKGKIGAELKACIKTEATKFKGPK